MQIDWNHTRVVLKNAGRVHCEPGWGLSPVWSQRLVDYDLWFICEGRGSMRLRDRTLELRPGVAIWMRPGGLYIASQDLSDRLTVGYAHFDLLDRHGKQRSVRRPLPPEVLTVMDTNLVDGILRRVASGPLTQHNQTSDYRQEAQHDPAAQALFRGLLMELDADSDTSASLASGTQLHHHQTVQKLAMRITQRPGQDHPVAELAREAGYSADHFARIFKAVMGISPQMYAIRARIDRARQLLAESSLTVSQVADVLGYEDVYFFSRQFKRMTGQSPRQYRQEGR